MKAARSGTKVRYMFAISLFVMATSLNAETLSFSTFRVKLENGWTHRNAGGDDKQAIIDGPDGNDTLDILTLHAAQSVSAEALRNMTNVDSAAPLMGQDWGDFSGYQYDYAAGRSFYRQWWLANEAEILLIVHTSGAIPDDKRIDAVNRMVSSLTAIN